MTVDQLSETLDNLSPGEVAVLSRVAFEAAFRAMPSLPEKRMAAITLGDWRACGVIFGGTDRSYVSFTRRRLREERLPAPRGEAAGAVPLSA